MNAGLYDRGSAALLAGRDLSIMGIIETEVYKLLPRYVCRGTKIGEKKYAKIGKGSGSNATLHYISAISFALHETSKNMRKYVPYLKKAFFDVRIQFLKPDVRWNQAGFKHQH